MSVGEKSTFWELIQDQEVAYIQIPQIQRDYVQGRNTPKVNYSRARLLDELYRSLVGNDGTVDLNFVYGKVENGMFVPIDGQQRLTTLFCLHVYAFAQEGDVDGLKMLHEKFQYATRKTTSRFLEALLEHIPEYFAQDKLDMIAYIEDAAWYTPQWEKDPSVHSFKVVLDEIDKKFRGAKLVDKLKDKDCPATFMSLKIPDAGKVNDLYIKMNSRGKLLTEFENFKSEMYDFIDARFTTLCGVDKKAFKGLVDNEWLTLVWDVCGEEAPKVCDAVYMQFIHQVFLNWLSPKLDWKEKKTKAWKNLNQNNGFYNFADYKSYMEDEALWKELYGTMEFYRFIMDAKNDGALVDFPEIREKFILLMRNCSKLEHSEKVRLFAITRYAVEVSQADWSIAGYIKWFRVINNLINNTTIDKLERCVAACISLLTVAPDMAADAYGYLLATDGADISFFENRQKKEEVFKCRLIDADAQWEDAILVAEKHPYFYGGIQFAFSLCQIYDLSDVSDHKAAIETFDETWTLVETLFNWLLAHRDEHDLFRRALLTFGDYSCPFKSSYTFYTSHAEYANWRRMLCEVEALKVFALFVEDFKNRCGRTGDIQKYLEACVAAYTDKSNEFCYYLITLPEVMKFMTKKMYRKRDAACDRTLFFSKERLSADYAEQNTFFVHHLLPDITLYHCGHGNLNAETSPAYICKVKDTDCHIEFGPAGCFCDEEGVAFLDASGQPITTVEDMVAYIHAHF